jgi:hypothetical protein
MAIPRPRLRSTTAGFNHYDPIHSSIFEVNFMDASWGNSKSKPLYYRSHKEAIKNILTVLGEQVTDVQGLDSLIKVADTGQQKFLGTTNSYANPMVDDTSAEITINFNLNLTDNNDAYVYEFFRSWYKRIYDVNTGGRSLMKDYVCKGMKISEANRDGSIWREFIFGKVILKSVSGLDSLDYTNNEARKLQCVFKVDWWDEITDIHNESSKEDLGNNIYDTGRRAGNFIW